jgi:hypothetical protein
MTVSCTPELRKAAEIIAPTDCVTAVVFAWNAVVACPALVETEAGGVKCESVLVRASGIDPNVVEELRVTWQVTGDPPTAVFGEHESDTGFSPTSDTDVCIDELPRLALMVAFSS